MSDQFPPLSALSETKRQLLMLRLMKANSAPVSAQIEARQDKTQAPPVSFAQQRLWFVDRLEPGKPFYNVPLAVRLRGALDQGVLRRALSEIARRHEAMRTTFSLVDGSLVQLIAPPPDIALPVADVLPGAPAQREDELVRLATAEALRPFDLAVGPLFRALLLRMDPLDHVLVLPLHHIAADAWSADVLFRELAAIYAAFAVGKPSPLSELKIQYADFAIWQRQRLTGELLERHAAYWKGQLEGASPLLALPTDRPRPAAPSLRGGKVPFILPRHLSEGLRELCRQETATPFMALVAAFKALLCRYSGQGDISVGTPVANRAPAQVEGLIGLFLNTLVLRTNLSDNPSFRELLGRVCRVALGAYEHQELPFEKLVEILNPERSFNHAPLFQVMFSLVNAAGEGPAMSGLTLSPFSIATGIARFDLSLAMADTDQGFAGFFEYSAALFDHETVARMAGHFRTLLEGAVAAPDRPVGNLSLLTEAEQHQALVGWNETRAPFPEDRCLHELIEAQAARTPEAVALVSGEERLTYGELNRRANQLAHHLCRLGVGPGALAGISLERSPELLVALLAVLKAGGAYLPLDPSYPQERLDFMLADAQAKVLLTRRELEAAAGAIAQESGENPVRTAGPGDLAYVLYTSGSTGRPKGVMVTHRNLVNFLSAMDQAVGCGPADTLLAVTSVSFDIAVLELFWTLASGARVVLAGDQAVRGEGFVRLLGEQQITLLQCTPSLMQLLLAEPEAAGGLGSLRQLLLGGEALSPALAGAVRERLPQARLLNMYGPTESAVWSAVHEVADVQGSAVPIGRPVANTQLYILDRQGLPAPVGVPGELYIGGAGVALGYLNRPDVTAERFVPDAFSGEPGARLYRTGDLTRRQRDGTVEFLGRADFQVKIRGLRIELGEIEAVLERHPAVAQAVVAAREDQPGDRRLVAYIVPAPGGAGDLRGYLKERLPEYMVPAAFVTLEALPLTPNGKVDRRALPAPEPVRAEAGAGEFVAPRTPAEEVVAAVWSQVLGVARVGARDDFFALGGHSLLAIQVIARLSEAFGVELPLRSLFEAPRVAEMAARAEEARRVGQGRQAPPLARADREGPLPLSYAQQRLWFLDQLEPGSPFYNMSFATRLVGQLDIPALERSLAELVRRHEALRTSFPAEGGRPVQAIGPAGPVSLPVIDLEGQPAAEREAEARRQAAAEAGRPFNLSRGPLLRAALLRLGPEEHVLLLSTHHIVCDGSTGILMRELAALYGAYTAGREPDLPALPLQYADFASWQRQRFQGEELDAHLAYWQEKLGGALPALELPTDRPRPPVTTYRGARRFLLLPADLSDKLRELSRREGVTLYMTLLAAFQTLLHRYSGQEQIIVGSPASERDRPELEGLVGCFVNALVLRTDLSGNPAFRELLGRVRETVLGAFDHQGLPFQLLVDSLSLKRDPSRTPLFQVMFSLQPGSPGMLELPGLTAAPLEAHSPTARFDLLLGMVDRPEGLAGMLEYNTDLFDEATIDRMLGHFRQLAEAVAADPARPVRALPLLTAEERHRALTEWNTTAEPVPAGLLQSRFIEQAALRPDHPAVIAPDRCLTYRELYRRANQVGRRLRELGVRPNTLVAVVMEKGVEQVVAVLGILQAGAAYLPLDPKLPRERLWHLLEQGEAEVALTQPRVDQQVHWPDTVFRMVVSDEALEGLDDQPLEPVQAPENLAYVIFTSGSTGLPKGVMIDHRGAVNTVVDINRRLGVGPEDRVLALSSLSFDLSVYDIFGLLAAGGSIVMPAASGTHDPAHWAALAAQERVTLWNTVPALLKLLLDHVAGRPALAPASLRCAMLSGDWIPLSLPGQLKALLPDVQVISLGGATEASIWSIIYPIDSVMPQWRSIPYGRPMVNQRFYVLDDSLEPCPVRVSGQLYIGGIGLAPGYWRDPVKTAASFIIHPRTGKRLYRTGDLGCYLPDGTIEFLGRADYQVKIRGFRVELGEIEAALSQHPAVREALVVARGEAGSDRRLVAYVVPAAGEAGTSSDLRGVLKAKLPEYMIPSAFVLLEALPLTANGKVDRKALPEPETAVNEREGSFDPPRTECEAFLATLWSQVLGIAQVSIHDNFFELGGDSILAIQVVARANQAGYGLTIAQYFQHQTIAALAPLAERSRTFHAEQGPVVGPVPLTPAQHWFFEQEIADPHHWNQARLLELDGPVDPACLKEAVGQLIIHHDALRLRFHKTKAGWEQTNAPPGEPVPFVRIDLANLPQTEQDGALEAAAAELQASLDLAEGPLLRAALFDMGTARPAMMLLIIHHLAVDAVSWHILLEDLATAYRQLRGGEPVQLPPKTTSFQHWGRRLTEYAASAPVGAELPYWLAPERSRVAPVPVDNPGGVNAMESVRSVTASLGREETGALLRRPPVEGRNPVNDLLLTALSLAFARWTSGRALLVDVEGHGRDALLEEVDSARTVGFFTAIYPVSLDLGEVREPSEALALVREQLSRLPNRGVHYGLLRYLSGDPAAREQLSALPGAQISFGYLGHTDQIPGGSGLFRRSAGPVGPVRSPSGSRRWLLDLVGQVTEGELFLTCFYSENLHQRSTVETMAAYFMEAIRGLLTNGQPAPVAAGFRTRLGARELDRLSAKLKQSDRRPS